MADDEMAEECDCPPPGAPAWMATFGDMMSLLVTFFVLLLSFANMDIVKFKRAMGSMTQAFGVERMHAGEFDAKSTSPVELSKHTTSANLDLTEMQTRPDSAEMNQRMLNQVKNAISAQNLDKVVEAKVGARGVVVTVKGAMLFDGGSDELYPEAYIFLDEIANLIREFPYHVSIEGHSDSGSIESERFPSNWHLSAARAIAALRYMVDGAGIERTRLSAAGYADTRPMVPNDSPENRAANRRVEFIYLRDLRLVTPRIAKPATDADAAAAKAPAPR
jgi:chemotaxis protein MotB